MKDWNMETWSWTHNPNANPNIYVRKWCLLLVLHLIDKQLKGNKEIKVKDTLKAFNDSRNKQQKSMKQYFLMYILKVYSIEKTEKIWEKTQIIKKPCSDKINGTKNSLFFLSQTPTHHNVTFNLRFL